MYDYDDAGHKLSERDALGNRQAWAYDEAGRVIDGSLQPYEDKSRNEIVGYCYDAEGNIASKNSSKVGSWIVETDYYQYDALGRLVSIRRRNPEDTNLYYPDDDHSLSINNESWDKKVMSNTSSLSWSEGTWEGDYDNLELVERRSRSVRFDNTVAWNEHEHGVNQLAHSLTVTKAVTGLELLSFTSEGQYDIDYDAIYVKHRGKAYRQSQVIKKSWYNRTPGSPIWGDADKSLQIKAIDALVTASINHGLNAHETAYVLATAHVESGFNPYASAGTTSACGLGQFINGTGKTYGINDKNRWDIDAQANALLQHFIDNKAIAQKRNQSEAYIYKYHHDGSKREFGGLQLSNTHVMPKIRGIHNAIAKVFY